jgi:hypothetical protein
MLSVAVLRAPRAGTRVVAAMALGAFLAACIVVLSWRRTSSNAHGEDTRSLGATVGTRQSSPPTLAVSIAEPIASASADPTRKPAPSAETPKPPASVPPVPSGKRRAQGGASTKQPAAASRADRPGPGF